MAETRERQSTIRGGSHYNRTVVECQVCGKRVRSQSVDKRDGGIKFECGHKLFYINAAWTDKNPRKRRRRSRAADDE